MREYQGERHTVTVVPDGFVWRGTTYASLSTIARAITGTAWGGPRFFGLRTRGSNSEDDKEPNDPTIRSTYGGRAGTSDRRHMNGTGEVQP